MVKLTNYQKELLNNVIELGSHEDDFMQAVKDIYNDTDEHPNDDTFSVCGVEYRVVDESSVLDMVANMLKHDHYLLGSFYPHSIESASGHDSQLVSIIQNNEDYEELGEIIAQDAVAVESLAEEYLQNTSYSDFLGNGGDYQEFDCEGYTYILVEA